MESCGFSMAAEQVVANDSFVRTSSFTVWYKKLKRDGSCLRVYDLLAERRELIHELGPEGLTALHKGVQHGCVKLVRFILVDMFDGDGKCTCRRCGADNQTCVLTRKGLLQKTCGYGSTAVNMAVVSGSPKMVLLLKWAIDVSERCTEMGLTEEDHSLREYEPPGFFIRREFKHTIDLNLGEKGKEEETEITNAAGIHLEVPDVKDDAIGENIYDADWSTKISEVYELIEEKLNKNWGDYQELMTLLKNMCEENVDFGFVPVAHIFLHFLFSIEPIPFDDSFERFRKEVFEDILVACKERDDKEGNSEISILVTLFNILDPRGRTILHVALETGESTDVIFEILRGIEETWKHPLASTRMRECVNAKDGAGRTILHLACIHNINRGIFKKEWMKNKLDWDVTVSPLRCEELGALKECCFLECYGTLGKDDDCKPIHLAIVFNSANVLEFMPAFEGVDSCLNAPYAPGDSRYCRIHLPFQIAAFLGRVPFVDHFLKSHTKSKCIEDGGLDTNYHKQCLPAIHCAALSGQVETIQTIVKYPIYDPICQHEDEGTALHLLLCMKFFKDEWEKFKILALLHALPNALSYVYLKRGFDYKPNVYEEWPRMFSEDEVSCINLLLQAGIDLWTPRVGHHTKEHPIVGSIANNQARKWWYDKVVKEVVTQKTSITSAANATSVVAALVATASIIGPLQPPLSYIGDGGYIDTTRSPVRVYLVCNSLSFFFSIASILMALLPAIPMPKESMYEELLRSQRCLKVAALMLLIAIVCTLISFSSASIAVVTPEWSDKQLVVVCVVIGGGVCLVVLAIYIIRLLRMVFHKNDRFRRRFVKYMYF